MKKILLTVAGSMFIALAAVHAQERSDTTKTDQPSSEYRTESGTQGETTTVEGKSGTQGQMNWREEDREVISREDLPDVMITTLEGDQYAGWEGSTIYRNRTSNEYMLVIDDNGEVKTYYFDKDGRAITNPDQASSGAGISGGTTTAPQTSSEVSQNPSGAGVDAKSTTGNPISNTDRASGNVQYNTDEEKRDAASSGVSQSTTVESTSGNVNNSTSVSGTESTTPTGDPSLTVTADAQPQWPADQKVKITTSQIPSAMLITLGDPMYKGWDKSTVYRNKVTNEYMMEITENGTTKTYYFDGSGAAKSYNTRSQQDSQMSRDQSSMNQDQSSMRDDKSSDNTAVSGQVTTGQPSSTSRTETDKTKDDNIQTTTSGAIGTSQVGKNDEKDRADTEEYSLNRASTQGPVETEQPSTEWRQEDRVVVESKDIPASLRVTLDDDDRYTGWENSTVYQNRTNNEYMVEIRDGSESHMYYFDKEGKAKEIKTEDNEGAARSGYTSTEQKIKPTGDHPTHMAWSDDDRVIIKSSDIPATMREALSDEKYVGWEKSTIYRNRSTNEYLIEINDGSDVRSYYFDRDGNAIVIEEDKE